MATTRLLIHDRYEVDTGTPIGEGGMALVYRGYDVRTRREVACKTLRTEFQSNAAHRRRFQQEAELIARIPHRNLVSIFDFVDDASGVWVIMELVNGPTLRKLLSEKGAQSPEQVARILDQLGDVFDVIHDKQLVHLDMKPQNVMIDDDGVVKLIDFGLAQHAGEVQRRTDGQTFGTVAYIAPEQASGQAVHPETDVYSIGCVVYELLTGRQPFIATSAANAEAELLAMHRSQLPRALTEVSAQQLPGWVDTAVGWALEKRPEDRYRRVSSFAESFRLGLRGKPLGLSARAPSANAMEAPGGHTRDIEDDGRGIHLEPSQPSWLVRKYQAGGRRARGARRLRRMAWRTVGAVALLLMVFVTLATMAGSPPGMLDRFREDPWDRTTTVDVDSLLIRSAPAKVEGNELWLLLKDDAVAVTGEPVESGGLDWVPVTCDCGAQGGGWTWEGGLDSPEWRGPMSWMNEVDSARDSVTGAFEATGNTIADLWP